MTLPQYFKSLNRAKDFALLNLEEYRIWSFRGKVYIVNHSKAPRPWGCDLVEEVSYEAE